MDGLKISPLRVSPGPAFYIIGGGDGAAEAAETCGLDAAFAVVEPPDWNDSLSPWPAPKCFRGGEDFGGGADGFIGAMEASIPAFEAEHGLKPETRFVCGYSLAGLCAVYALYRTDIFAGAASVSGSMWFDGWIDFAEASPKDLTGRCVYLSVGDAEKRTRNRRFAAVEEGAKRTGEIMAARGARTMFELNPGNHFVDHGPRMARGMAGLGRLSGWIV